MVPVVVVVVVPVVVVVVVVQQQSHVSAFSRFLVAVCFIVHRHFHSYFSARDRLIPCAIVVAIHPTNSAHSYACFLT